MKDILILGGGGHAKVLISVIESMKEFAIRGIIDSKLPVGSTVLNYRVLGDDDFLTAPAKPIPCLALGVGMTGSKSNRKTIFERFKNLGYSFPCLKHEGAIVSKAAAIGEGAQIMANAVIQPDARIGKNTIINTSAVIEHDCEIGAHSHVAPGAVLGGQVTVGEGTLVGLGARVLPGIHIGHSVVIGAGAVVVKDVQDGRVVAGMPAREFHKI